MTIPILRIRGDAARRGEMLGQQTADRIRATFDFYYHRLFRDAAIKTDEIVRRAHRIIEIIGDYSTVYLDELKGIANGAAVDLWQVVVINARTEVMNASAAFAECTAIFDQETKILGQTWDWMRELEDLMVLVHYEFPDGHEAITLAEPGMPAKIGFNSYGLGVCLNFLSSPIKMDGVPVHTVLRALLDCRDLEEAKAAVARSGMGKTSHILVASHTGEALGFEFAGGKMAVVAPQNGYLLHTNHCLAPGLSSTKLASTYERFERARELLKGPGPRDVEAIKAILLDGSQGAQSIQSPYHASETFRDFDLGTCATLVMDLRERVLHYRKGPEPGRKFERFVLAPGSHDTIR